MAPSSSGPPLLPPAELQARSIDTCKGAVEATLEYRVEPLVAHVGWDSIALRHVHDQPLVLWRAFGALEVVLDDQDRPVGFVDEDKWHSCSWRELPPGEVERLARATGLVPPGHALAGSAPGPRGCLELRFDGPPAHRAPLRVRGNPERRAVISVEPEDAPP